MIELDDCGRELHLTNLSGLQAFDTTIQMVIKAPRGTIALFSGGCTSAQYESIRTFMEEHKNDTTKKDTNATG